VRETGQWLMFESTLGLAAESSRRVARVWRASHRSIGAGFSFGGRLLLATALLALPLSPLGLSQSVTTQTPKVDSTAAGLPPDRILTLTEAVEIGLQANPLTRVAAAQRQLAAAQFAEAQAARLPVLQASENFTGGNNPVFVFGSLLEQGRFGPANFDIRALNQPQFLGNVRSSLTLRWTIFDRWQRQSRLQQARIGQAQADRQTEVIAQQIRFTVLRAFYDLLLAQANVQVADEAIRTAEADVKRTRELVEGGMVVSADLLAAQVQLAEFRQQKIQFTSDVATGRAAINTALGRPANTPLDISGQLSDREFTVASEDDLIQQALLHRPEYERAKLAVDSSEQRLREAKGQRLPRVDAFASVGVSGRSPVTGSSDYTVGTAVSIDLFDAGRRARVDQASAVGAEARAQQEQLGNQIGLEVVRAYQQFLAARERLVVANAATDQAREALRVVQDRYRAGLTTVTEVLRAETALVRAQTNVLASRHAYYLSYASILLTTGQMNDVHAFVS
jgi:outer membrane protein